MSDFKENDRVKRKDQKSCLGTIIQIREETGRVNKDPVETNLIKVLWDNGSTSYYSAQSLEAA